MSARADPEHHQRREHRPAQQFALSFGNSGKAGAAYRVYSSLRTDGPWYYTVEAGKSIEQEVWNWSGASYDLSVHGANGFLRQFKGATALASGARPELQTAYDIASGDIQLILSNLDGLAACVFTITDNAYGAEPSEHGVAPGPTGPARLAQLRIG
eukprot:gene32541-36741_t